MSDDFGVTKRYRGVFFRIGNQEFHLANTEWDPDDPDSEPHRVAMAKMLYDALERLAGNKL